MKIYLAARYSYRKILCEYRNELQAMGHTVTSSWLDTQWEEENPDGTREGPSAAPPEARENWVLQDYRDVLAADMVISFNGQQKGRGGRHVEFGIGLASQKIMVFIGEPENLFHFFPGVLHFDSWGTFIKEFPRMIFGGVSERETGCNKPPKGWYCTREKGHEGPCAAHPQNHKY